MQYALLVYETSEAFESRGDRGGADPYVEAWRAFYQSMLEAGVYAGGNPLQPPRTATTVRRRRDGRQVHDGPYAETKEVLGGFIVLELPSLNAALEWADRCPAASIGAVEIRPLAATLHARITDPDGADVDPARVDPTTT